MNKKDVTVLFARPRRFAALVFLAGLLCLASRVPAQRPQGVVAPPETIDAKTTLCLGLRIAASSTDNVIVGWATDDPSRGICYRQRVRWIWDPVRHVGGAVGVQPRDLNMAFDHAGRVNMVWTGLDGAVRKVYFARMELPGTVPQAAPLFATAPADSGDADFPTIAADDHGGVVIVWQESREMRFSIRAAYVPPTGVTQDLGRVSGDSFSGLTPQVLATQPALQVAWYEVDETGASQLRVNDYSPYERIWRPSATEREARLFPRDTQMLLGKTAGGLLACWPDSPVGGRNAIKLEVDNRPGGGAPNLTTTTLSEPAGQHTRPAFSGSLPGRLTLSWQVLTPGIQAVQVASIQQTGKPPVVLTASTPAQRFAAMPDHVTLGYWSGVVWTDDKREGGAGKIYFSQIIWPTK